MCGLLIERLVSSSVSSDLDGTILGPLRDLLGLDYSIPREVVSSEAEASSGLATVL